MKDNIKRILVVDDVEERRKGLSEFLLSRGHIVFTAANGVQAISAIINTGVDIVIIKASLPGITGYDAAPIIKMIDPDVRTILTVDDDREPVWQSASKTVRVDFFEFITEPISFEAITNIL